MVDRLAGDQLLPHQQGREHIVLEQAARAANVWRNERWDSFTLVTPNWTLKMPGAEYDGADRDGFMPRDEVVAYFERYVDRFALPVHYNARVLSIEPMDDAGYRVVTAECTYAVLNVVIATGFEQHPGSPRSQPAYRHPSPRSTVAGIATRNCCRRARCSSSAARSSAPRLPRSSINTVAASSSASAARAGHPGAIAAGMWSTGCPGSVLRHHAGQAARSQRAFRPSARFGRQWWDTLNLHQFARDGVTLLGHLRGASGDTISLAP